MYDIASELYNELLEIYFDEYFHFSGAKRKETDSKYDPANLIVDTYYLEWFKKDVESAVIPSMPPPEVDKEVKEGKGLKILTPNKLLTSLSALLAQVKADSNSYKLKIEIRQILYLMYQHNKIAKTLYNNSI